MLATEPTAVTGTSETPKISKEKELTEDTRSGLENTSPDGCSSDKSDGMVDAMDVNKNNVVPAAKDAEPAPA